MNPICMEDKIAMTCTTNGVTVVEMAHNLGPYKLWQADEFTCPVCGAVVIANFADRATAHYIGETFVDKMNTANEQGLLRRWYERVSDVVPEPSATERRVDEVVAAVFGVSAPMGEKGGPDIEFK